MDGCPLIIGDFPVRKPLEYGDFPMKIDDFPMNIDDFPVNIGDFW